jgi:hypothetical protein
MKNFVPLSLSALAMLFMWFLAWLGGYDFDERGFMVAYWMLLSCVVGYAVYQITKTKD